MSTIHTPIRLAVVLSAILAIGAVGTALAAHGLPFHSTLLADGTWGRAERTEFLSALAAQGSLDGSRVVTVSVIVDPSSSIDWHGHSGPSVVAVTGGNLQVTERARSGNCTTATYGAGAAFFHTAGPHRFTNPNATPATFVVTYFAPSGPLVHAADPGC